MSAHRVDIFQQRRGTSVKVSLEVVSQLKQLQYPQVRACATIAIGQPLLIIVS